MSIAASHELFDRPLQRRRLKRALSAADYPWFLEERIAHDLAGRLAGIQRACDPLLLAGAGAQRFAGLFAGADAPRTVFALAEAAVSSAADFPPPSKAFETGRVVASLEALPLAGASLGAAVCLPGLERTNDPIGALVQLRQALKPDGLFLACMIGGNSLHELRQAWLAAETALLSGASPRVAPFADITDLGGLLQRAGFSLPVSDSDRVTLTYADPLSAMREVKALGWSNALAARARAPVSRRLLLAAAEAYSDLFGQADGRVPLSLELIYLTAWTPHDSQPKPLKPGSARTRLADALGTSEKRF